MIGRYCELFIVGGELYVVSLRETDGPLVWSSVVGKTSTAAAPEEVGQLALFGVDAFSREPISFAEGLAKASGLFAELSSKSRRAFFARKPKMVLVEEGQANTVAVTPTKAVGREYQHDITRRLVCPRQPLEVGQAIKGFI